MFNTTIVFKFGNAEYISPIFKTNQEKIDWFYDDYIGSENSDYNLFWNTDIYGNSDSNSQNIVVDFFQSPFNKTEAARLSKVLSTVFDEAPIDEFNNWVKK